MKTKCVLFLAIVLSGLSLQYAPGVEGLTLSVQGNDAVLRWQSQSNAIYIVQYRATLDPNDVWQTLTNAYPAAVGTNRTTFVHTNAVCWPSGNGGGGGGGSGGPPSPNSFSSSSQSNEKDDFPPLPPSPWEISNLSSSKEATFQSESSSSNSVSSFSFGGNSCNPVNTNSNVCSGFYRVFAPTPITRLDIFGVEQGSVSNQLDILENDIDPDDNPILLSSVQAASHGLIEYSDDGSIFLYSPTNAFSGMDTFSYSITNNVGGSNSASVFVFVNESGNNHPSAPPLEFTLFTNQAGISFPILTNATDADSNSLQLAVIEQPSRGTAETNANGEIVYTRTSNYLTQDRFLYVLTDGHGGFVKRPVTIIPQDDDGDGMPDEWELAHFGNLDQGPNDDPDADGLPNLAEYKLDTCPNGADNPLNLGNIATNQTFRDYALIPVPLKSHVDQQPISLLINSNRADAFLTKRADQRWYINWNTIWMTNGNYSIALNFQYSPGAVPPAPAKISGATKNIIVTNQVAFAKWTSEFSHTLVLDLTFAYQNANFRVEFYDEQNQPLVYYTSSTTNGTELAAWDLTFNGQQIAFSHVRAAVFTLPTGSGSLPPPFNPTNVPSGQLWFIKQTGSVSDTFAVAWGWDAYTFAFNNRREQLMRDSVINIVGNPSSFDSYTLSPQWNIPYTSTFRYDNDDDKELLLNALKSSGNFFWFGHGNADAIAGNVHKSNLLSDDVERVLENKKHRSTRTLLRDNKRPYRLVILNGCDTYHAGWANAFGIDFSETGSTNIVLEYQFTGRKPQAFVAWTDQGLCPGAFDSGGIAHAQYGSALSELFSRWMGGYPLDICMDFFADTATGYGFTNQDKWRISGCSDLKRHDP